MMATCWQTSSGILNSLLTQLCLAMVSLLVSMRLGNAASRPVGDKLYFIFSFYEKYRKKNEFHCNYTDPVRLRTEHDPRSLLFLILGQTNQS